MVSGLGHAVDYTFAEYLALEETSNTRHEFFGGQIYAMAGGTPEHSALIASLTVLLGTQLRGGRCRVHASDLRVRVLETGLTTYPDVSVISGPWARDPEDPKSVVNPLLVAEVLSRSTEAYDRGEKLEHYKRIPALRACLLVAHDRREIEVWTRASADAAWERGLFGSGQEVRLEGLGVRVEVDRRYDEAAEP